MKKVLIPYDKNKSVPIKWFRVCEKKQEESSAIS